MASPPQRHHRHTLRAFVQAVSLKVMHRRIRVHQKYKWLGLLFITIGIIAYLYDGKEIVHICVALGLESALSHSLVGLGIVAAEA